jgi:hypothetical protein
LSLNDQPRWSLVLGGAIDADLTSLVVTDLSLNGGGVVRLGAAVGETAVSVGGSFQIVVPTDSPARVIGVASAPSSWTSDAEGALAPTFGEGWVITIEPGADVRIVEGPSSNQ